MNISYKYTHTIGYIFEIRDTHDWYLEYIYIINTEKIHLY